MADYIDRQAAIDAIHNAIFDFFDICADDEESPITYKDEQLLKINKAITSRLKALPSARPEPKWIPVKFRPMDSEEREYFEEQFGEELADEDAVMFDCPMPEDGQEILVSYRKWISMDKCEIDGGCYGLEGNGDWDGVIAWTPLPEPYGERRTDG